MQGETYPAAEGDHAYPVLLAVQQKLLSTLFFDFSAYGSRWVVSGRAQRATSEKVPQLPPMDLMSWMVAK